MIDVTLASMEENVGDIFEKKYALNYFDFDKNYKLKPMTMMNFLQDISTIHFETRTGHVSKEILNGLWVIVEWQIYLDEMPDQVMSLTIKTEPTYFRKFIAYRNYKIEDESGRCIGSGYSKWAYINPETRRQSNLPKILNEIFMVEENADKPDKLIFEAFETHLFEDTHFTSVYSDLDINKHVNNVTYIRWAIDTLGSEFLDYRKLSALKVSFKREVFEGENVRVSTAKKETAMGAVSSHFVFNNDGELCVQLELDWLQNI